jgi:hypothetical protein
MRGVVATGRECVSAILVMRSFDKDVPSAIIVASEREHCFLMRGVVATGRECVSAIFAPIIFDCTIPSAVIVACEGEHCCFAEYRYCDKNNRSVMLVLVLVLRCLSKTLEYSICIGDAVWLVSELLI